MVSSLAFRPSHSALSGIKYGAPARAPYFDGHIFSTIHVGSACAEVRAFLKYLLWFAKTPSEARPLRISNILDNPKSSAPNLFGRNVTMLHRNGVFLRPHRRSFCGQQEELRVAYPLKSGPHTSSKHHRTPCANRQKLDSRRRRTPRSSHLSLSSIRNRLRLSTLGSI